MAVTILQNKVKKVCYIVGASKERTPRATKIAQALDAEIIDCPSKVRRYTTFPVLLPITLAFSRHDIVIVNNIPTHVVFSVWIASKFRKFVLVVDFVNFWRFAVSKKFKALSGMASYFENWIYRRIKYGLAINDVIAKSAEEAGVEIVKVVHDAADHELFRPSFNLAPVVAIAANLRRDEGVDVLLNAMKTVKDEFPNIKCLVAGSGEEENSLKELAKKLELDSHVEFLGWIPHSNLPQIYEHASVGVVSIRTLSPFALPIKLFEYMSSGLAVISTDTATIRTIIRDGENGLLFPTEDFNTLASLIMGVLSDSGLMRKLQKGARHTVEVGLNWRSESEKLMKFVNDVSSEENNAQMMG
jgi:glycosyltransferase involved in cell wall biosynthesis